jgi:hypothetical protein
VGALVALAVFLGAPAALAAVQGTVVVSPNHGKPAAPLAATFKVVSSDHRCPMTASFWWDGIPVGAAQFSSACTATVKFTPPENDRAPGVHTVTAAAQSGSVSASASYIVEVGPTPSRTASPSPTSTPRSTPTTGAPTPSQTQATPTAAPTDSALSSPELETATGAPVVIAPTSGTPAAASGTKSSLSALALMGGGGLVLVGVVAMGLLFLNSRRHAAEDDLADATVDPNADTQTDLRAVGLDGLLPRRVPMEAPPQPETG